MRILQRNETDEVKTLRTIVRWRHQGTCTECKTSFEANWTDLEGFKDPESHVHVHCPVCYQAQIVEPEAEILDYLRNTDVTAVEVELDDEE
jgi:hypothetical protein